MPARAVSRVASRVVMYMVGFAKSYSCGGANERTVNTEYTIRQPLRLGNIQGRVNGV